MRESPGRMPKGKGMLGILLKVKQHPKPDEQEGEEDRDDRGPMEDDHEDHDEKHAAAEEIANILGVQLKGDELHRLCEALSAFSDAHEAERSDEDADRDTADADEDEDEEEGY
jgi:hypothetical protein